MSRADLDKIQGQLRVAIQNHQMLVSRMKVDAENVELKKQLYELQREITSLSEKQKSIVQQLRKELVNKQSTPVSNTQVRTAATSSSPANTNVVMTTTVNKVQPLNLALNNNNPVKTESVKTVEAKKPNKLPTSKAKSTQKPVTNSVPSPSSLKIPQYHKPSILQGGGHKSPRQLQSVLTKPPPPSSSLRKQSDSDNGYSRFSLDNKDLTPEEKMKLQFMAALDLVTPDMLKELQTRRSERKRRSTANPQFSYSNVEPERKRVSGYLTPSQRRESRDPNAPVRKRGRPPKHPRPSPPSTQVVAMTTNSQLPIGGGDLHGDTAPVVPSDIHEDVCAECHLTGELLMCDTCNLVFHLHCLQPPLNNIPTGFWSCPKCKALGQTGSSDWSGTLPVISSYMSARNNKQEEKQSLLDKQRELLAQKSKYEAAAQQLKEKVASRVAQKSDLHKTNSVAQDKVNHLTSFIQGFRT